MVTLGFFEFFPTKPMCDVVYLQSRGTQCGVVGGARIAKSSVPSNENSRSVSTAAKMRRNLSKFSPAKNGRGMSPEQSGRLSHHATKTPCEEQKREATAGDGHQRARLRREDDDIFSILIATLL
jgi:hypothetical protein